MTTIKRLLRALVAAWAAFWLPTDPAWRYCGVER
jgi:hypothetical protein